MKLRAAFADETDAAKRKELAVAMQVRVSENPTHAFLGQWYAPMALRKNVTGNLESPVTIFWNIEKKMTLRRQLRALNANSAPDRMPVGQRAVTVLSLV